MPKYDYRCHQCGKTDETYRSLDDFDLPDRCPCCGYYRDRVIGLIGGVRVPWFEAGHYAAFGKSFTSKRELDNEILRIRGEENREIVEVGNSSFPSKPTYRMPDKRDVIQTYRAELRKYGSS